MIVIPAIDIRGGKCARLYRGDYSRETVFDEDPVDAAKRWAGMGAKRLHVIDLDGARDGVRANIDAVSRIVRAVEAPVQVGGGIRDADDARQVIESGAEMVIFGTAAVEHPEEVGEAVAMLGNERVCVSVDAREGMVQTRGWLESSCIRASALMREMAGARGVRHFIYTDTSRDGTLSHPNFKAISELIGKIEYPIVIAGGVATLDDLLRLRAMGVAGAITGMAIYTGSLDLSAAIKAIGN